MKVKFDSATQKWFENRPCGVQTTVMCCSDCGLYYKPSIGHKCKKKKEVVSE